MSLQDERELLSPPGDTILETIRYMGMSQVGLAVKLGVDLPFLKRLLVGEEVITPDLARKLADLLGIAADFWLRREEIYRQKLAELE